MQEEKTQWLEVRTVDAVVLALRVALVDARAEEEASSAVACAVGGGGLAWHSCCYLVLACTNHSKA